jgi:hypothetical protein
MASLRALVILAASAAAALAQNPPPANPFCGYMLERNTVTLDLFCVNGVIDAVTIEEGRSLDEPKRVSHASSHLSKHTSRSLLRETTHY